MFTFRDKKRIVVNIASAMMHLHSLRQPHVIFPQMTTHNVRLTINNEPKILLESMLSFHSVTSRMSAKDASTQHWVFKRYNKLIRRNIKLSIDVELLYIATRGIRDW